MGKELFHIQHYWAAFEFASGRGQIHTHLLAITSDQVQRLKYYYSMTDNENHLHERTKLMATYCRDILEMTANHPGYNQNDEIQYQNIESNSFKDTLNQHYFSTDNDIDDQKCLSHCVQIHQCNSFCLRKKQVQGNIVEFVQVKK